MVDLRPSMVHVLLSVDAKEPRATHQHSMCRSALASATAFATREPLLVAVPELRGRLGLEVPFDGFVNHRVGCPRLLLSHLLLVNLESHHQFLPLLHRSSPPLSNNAFLLLEVLRIRRDELGNFLTDGFAESHDHLLVSQNLLDLVWTDEVLLRLSQVSLKGLLEDFLLTDLWVFGFRLKEVFQHEGAVVPGKFWSFHNLVLHLGSGVDTGQLSQV
mmetsp:Transcript_78510/g.123854  ORF Transcript_78510/g.123854 Transcript_78510/m.123854 type:complete len:216 (+) Transcript_78510:387-1034(+)